MNEEKNYITPAGLELLKSEYHQLFHVERPKLVETIAWAASNGDRSENADYIYGKRRLREIDRRLGFLSHRLEKAFIVDAKKLDSTKIIFAATVTISNEDGAKFKYQIVGEDETDTPKGKISWKSPMAKALLGKKVGDEAIVRKPIGEEVFIIEKIEFI